MQKRICLIVALVFALAVVPAAMAETVRVLSPPVLSVLPFYWMQENGALADVNLEIELSPDHLRSLGLIGTGQAEYLITGLNVGAKAYNKEIPVQLVNVNAWKLDYLVSSDKSISRWQDLIGKRIALPLQGGPLDFLVQDLLAKEQLPAAAFRFVYAPVPQMVQLFNLGQVDAVVLPEPAVSQVLTANPKAKVSIDLQQEWAKWHEGEARIPYVALYSRTDWAAANPQLAATIADCYEDGIAWMNQNTKEAAALASEVLGLPEAVVAKGWSRVQFAVFDDAFSRKMVEEHLGEMLEFNPDLTAGKVPDADFFWTP